MRRGCRVPVVLVAVAATCACAEPLEFADWTIPVQDGTPVFEYAMVPMSERRANLIVTEPELVLGANPDDSNTAFYRSRQVVVDTNGRIYVLDTGNQRVQVFETDGSFIRSLGGPGQGPGELGRSPAGIEVVGNRVMVFDRSKRRFVSWALDGTINDEVLMEGAFPVLDTMATTDGSLVLLHSRIHGQPLSGASIPRDFILQRFDANGQPGITYLSVASTWPDSGLGFALEPAYAVDPSGIVYVSTSEEYQIHALSMSGAPRWALRVNWPRRSTVELLERFREIARRTGRYESEADIERALEGYRPRDLVDSLVTMRVDGHGHIYVVLNITSDERKSLQLHPGRLPFAVDVYSRKGEHLFSGILDGSLWDAAIGDYVYYGDHDSESDEAVVVRAFLREPFAR